MRKAAFISALALCSAAHAAPPEFQYTTVVRWTDAKQITQFSGSCSAIVSQMVAVDDAVSYQLDCPSFKKANVVIYRRTHLASINGWLPARVSYPVKDTVSLSTAQGETLTFVEVDCKKDGC